jgi:HAD superfamily hydrolase (TIGR01549 family)
MIKHIWFDFSETIAMIHKEAHDKLRYESYAKVKNQEVTPDLMKEYEDLYEEHSHSNSAIFHALGLTSGFWEKVISSVDPRTHYKLMEDNIPILLKEMSDFIPISIFSNINLEKLLPGLGIDAKLFKNILSASMVGKPKPALDGFYKMIELSGLKPEEILYIGDDLKKDIIPAKSVGIKTGFIYGVEKQADYSFVNFNDILEFVKNKNNETKENF